MKTATALILALAASPAFAHFDHGKPHIHMHDAIPYIVLVIVGVVIYFRQR